MIVRLLLFVLFLTASIWAKIPASTEQLLVVTTPSWRADHGILQRYEKHGKGWKKVGKSIAVKVGKNGLAWGKGLHHTPRGTKRIKREGDGKAPAGSDSPMPLVTDLSAYAIPIIR